ncbi:hypothetical protein DYBT9275_02333 [Dyadobacter sp. CECT 9275]|uniref:Sigma-70 family RNA polymerase sigma factor n=1 Tax=Dyadobacter helix TaxID=2822344 RepID=A0A916JDX3_9BACT|nr:sigma-70 family RNA polymerase sigma factor [Dyadobacter sp. CECT 9275]CAG4999876.1 hypothetical protein DYBT9275_02333 [Dyadobacter sp. CECT 9275]
MTEPKHFADREEEHHLWKELTEGNEAALAALMRSHYKPLLNYGYKFIKDEEFIKDCIQDTFIEIWNKRKQLSEPDSVRAYLFICLRRKVFRNGSKLKLFRQHDTTFLDETDLSVEFSPEWWMIKEESMAERTRDMANMLNALPRRQREVVYLKYYQELTREEIAGLMAIAPQTVSNLLQMAFDYLRRNGRTTFISLLFSVLMN